MITDDYVIADDLTGVLRYLTSHPSWEIFPGAAAWAARVIAREDCAAMHRAMFGHHVYYARHSRRAMRRRAMWGVGSIELIDSD